MFRAGKLACPSNDELSCRDMFWGFRDLTIILNAES